MNNAVNTQIKEYSATEAGLAALREKYQGRTFDVATAEGDKEARSARRELVTLRTTLEAKRKELKGPALEYAKRIDTEAKRIEGEIRALEEPIDAAIKAEEARKAEEKAERERIERERVAKIRGQIDIIRNLPVESTGDTADQINATLADLTALQITEAEYAEFADEARSVRDQVAETLAGMLGDAQAREAEAARLAAERAELERQRQEQEARERAEREAQEAEARKLAEERAEFERQKAAFEAKQRADQEAREAEARAKAEADQPEPVREIVQDVFEPQHEAEAKHPVQTLIEEAGGQVGEITRLPDGSSYAVVSFELPSDHWLTAEGANVPPMPLRMANGPARQAMAEKVQTAARYAVRASTRNGAEEDFDPDAMVQNMVVGLLGYWTEDGASMDPWENPEPLPVLFEPEGQ